MTSTRDDRRETDGIDDTYDIAPPDAPCLLHSLRSGGYDLESAVSDIVDNSIAAFARNVEITISDEGAASWVAITDDGHGMDEPQLRRAMTIGSIHPGETRSPEDLGRFGLGLKTASLSQCRRVTVFSLQKGGQVHVRCWDLDLVERTKAWSLLRECPTTNLDRRFREHLVSIGAGTVVLWERFDKLGKGLDDESIGDRLRDRLPGLERHLAMVFHRFVEESGLKILLGGESIEPWDPFLRKEDATQLLGEETHSVNGQPVTFRLYILPHKSKLTETQHRSGAGPRGWSDHQGFYVYRNRRLLVAGSWLGLGFVKEEHHKLVRIQVDFPNALDFQWDIDVRKSKAVPPHALREDFRRIARRARSEAQSIYRHRGRTIARGHCPSFLWESKVLHGRTFFRLNREHPVVSHALESIDDPGARKLVQSLLQLIEQTIPVPAILITEHEAPESIRNQELGLPTRELVTLFRDLFEALVQRGTRREQAFDRLAGSEPFSLTPEILPSLRQTLVDEADEGGPLPGTSSR